MALLDAPHGRADFDCDSPALNRYLQQQAAQDVRRRVAACFEAVTDDDAPRIAGC